MSDLGVEIANTSDIPDGTAKIYEFEDISLAVCNVNGDFFAIENVCTHDEGPLGEGKLSGCEIECPRHGARFDVKTGAVKRMPAYGPVQTFPVTVENDKIYVNIEEE